MTEDRRRQRRNRGADTPDEKLDLHRLHCRYAIRWAAEMQIIGDRMKMANSLWESMKGRYPTREGHLSALRGELASLKRRGEGDPSLNRDFHGKSSEGSTEQSFTHEEVFPLIARLIVAARSDSSGFVPHEEVVKALLEDREGSVLVARAAARSSLPDWETVASNMVAWFSQQMTVGRSPWSEFFDRERRKDVWAYRPITARSSSIPTDEEISAIEGDPRVFFHLRRERDAALIDAKRRAARSEAGVLQCEACGFVTREAFPGIQGEVCEVHHLLPLAEVTEQVETALSDLAVLCANCHRAIHRTEPMMTVETFRATFFPNANENGGVEGER